VILGWLPGGLAIVALAACAMFTAFTGASGATIVALGALLYPAMKQAGYPEKFNLGLITSAGSLGLLFAPSLPLILYAVVAQQMTLDTPVSIDDPFLAGILPGVLMVVLLSLWAGWKHRFIWRRDSGSWSWKEAREAVIDAAWEIPLPFAVLGGIYGGYIAVSEAAVLTAFYVIVIEVFIHREIPFKRLPGLIREAMIMVGGILIILGVSLASTNYMIDAEIPAKVFETVRAHIDSKLAFLILLNIFLLMLGMMLDIFSAIMIMIPLLLPIAAGYGVHPVHLGIIFLANMQLGYFTPPVGMNLFIASYRFNKSILELCIATLPFFFILLLAVLIITYWSGLSLMLPGL
jgi:tripartite ATP-independent transporter DctM subunit